MSETKSEYKTSTLLQDSKKRKIAEKVVITVKTEENAKRLKNEGPPTDCWSWRKYGQKPIKGSPYPRGYYRCSTSKGCSAKKQVERSKTDASLFVITYTSSHNHPDPNSNDEEEPKAYPVSKDSDMTPQQDQGQDQEAKVVEQESHEENESFHYSQSPYNSTTTSSQDILVQEDKNPFTHDNLGTTCDDEVPLSYPQLMDFPKSELSEENDFYDELGELQLPASSTYSFTCFSNSICFEERALVNFS